MTTAGLEETSVGDHVQQDEARSGPNVMESNNGKGCRGKQSETTLKWGGKGGPTPTDSEADIHYKGFHK